MSFFFSQPLWHEGCIPVAVVSSGQPILGGALRLAKGVVVRTKAIDGEHGVSCWPSVLVMRLAAVSRMRGAQQYEVYRERQ